MSQIKTSKGYYLFTPVDLEIGNHIINKEIAKDNLLDLKSVLTRHEIPFFLDFGTLLGAVRECDFIDHDEDVDIGVFDEYRSAMIETLFELRNLGFEVVRYKGDILSIMRKGEYIDIYFYRKKPFGLRVFNNEKVKEKYIKKTIEYFFLGDFFPIPSNYEEYLTVLYGSDWRIPKYGFHAFNVTRLFKIKQFVKRNFPKIYKCLKVFWFKIIVGAKGL